MKKRTSYNPKRRLAPTDTLLATRLCDLAKQARYGGNPEHKSRPNDYGLTPPSNPRPGKTLCDAAGEFSKERAETLLRSGLNHGMVSDRSCDEWPQNIWAVEAGEAFEAQLENRDQGIYHGYPMALDDPFRAIVLKEWIARER